MKMNSKTGGLRRRGAAAAFLALFIGLAGYAFRPADDLAAGLGRELAKDRPDTRSILFFQKYGITQLQRSPDGRHAVFAQVVDRAQPAMQVFDAMSGETDRVTDGASFVFDPAVNERGDHVYALYEKSVTVSKLFLNGQQIGSRDGLYKVPVFAGDLLVAH